MSKAAITICASLNRSDAATLRARAPSPRPFCLHIHPHVYANPISDSSTKHTSSSIRFNLVPRARSANSSHYICEKMARNASLNVWRETITQHLRKYFLVVFASEKRILWIIYLLQYLCLKKNDFILRLRIWGYLRDTFCCYIITFDS